ncbi:MAG TPA: glycerophosphodiester phosphodiesterase family protein [Marisediminicola sp.]|nr:glycerophosphodiester phosphodiesterase family protein [Marisediminicola sp.]
MLPPAVTLPLIIAHRGASGYHPEHTYSAFKLAIDQGADALEPDLVASRDGVLVIRHENEISLTTDVASRPEFARLRTTKVVNGVSRTGWFTEDFTWAELTTLRSVERLPDIRRGNVVHDGRDRMLRFEELLALVDAQDRPVGVVAEIKDASYFASLGFRLDTMLASALAAAGWTDDERLTVESFELSFFASMRASGVGGRFVYLIKAKGSPADQPDVTYASYLTDEGLRGLASVVDGISVNKLLLLAQDSAGGGTVTDLVSRAHAAGLTIYCWTLRAENEFLGPEHQIGDSPWGIGNWAAEFGLLMASGIDGIFTDQPDLAVIAREQVRVARASVDAEFPKEHVPPRVVPVNRAPVRRAANRVRPPAPLAPSPALATEPIDLS